MSDLVIRNPRRKNPFYRVLFKHLKKLWERLLDLRIQIVGAAFKSGAAFAVGALFVAFIAQPYEQRFIPGLIELLGFHQVLYIYDPNRSLVEPDDKYKFLVPSWGGTSSGRMVQIATDDPLLKDRSDSPRVFSVKGNRENGLLMFIFRSTSDKGGGGTFIGEGSAYRDLYVGELTGMGHDNNGQCRLIRYWAIVGRPGDEARFPTVLKDYIAHSSDKQAAAPAVQVPCGERKTASLP
jgi:hypothetical protein